ncbi:uncharacterized protein [Porites lutea]|uniref:uncharacterized protein n=1 Tax=Porites lutea TaxID=51062 RepID=UPI003CC52401
MMAPCTYAILYVLLAAPFSYLICEGSAVCYKCDSKSDAGCTPESLSGVATTTCSRDHEFCAVYKKEPPGNSSLHQYTRYCASECGIVCHYCNSKEGECSTNSLYGTREYSCGGDYHHCALYRKVLPNGTTAQVVRSCERDCNRPVIRWTVGKYQKTSHCKLCCDSDFCNGQLKDPCSNSTRLTSKEFLVILLVILGLCA